MPTKLSHYCNGVIEAAWLVAIILIPLFFNIYSSRIFEPDKITILRSLALIILAAWTVKIVEEGRLSSKPIQPGETSIKSFLKIPLVPGVIALVVVYILATIFSVTPKISLWGSYQRLQGTYTTLSYLVIFAALLGNLRKRDQVDRILTTLILVSLPISLYGILQRYKIDPIPWGGDVTIRIAANMGNSIFVAAYLIMVFPIVMIRIIEAFRAILRENSRLPMHVARATIYVFIASVDVIAIYMSGSRGPALGFLLGLFIFSLLITWLWRKRWLTFTLVGLALGGIVLLGVFNIPNGPLEALRSSPAVGRFGRLMDADSNSARVRRYIWEGTVKLVSIHTPLKYPNGGNDALNFLRPLIGYGPESMYVAYNPFYIPELGQVEKRNASPDRSHNETWDSIVITGVFGLVVYLLIFISVFYWGLKWIGLINNKKQIILFLALCSGSGLVGAIGLMLWRGIEYMGLGLPLGITLGVTVYIAYFTLMVPYGDSHRTGQPLRYLILIALFTAIISHYVEINFGIAIAATHLYFWVYSGLLLLIGIVLPRYSEYLDTAVTVEQTASNEIPTRDDRKKDTRSARTRRQRKMDRSYIQPGAGLPRWVMDALVPAGIISILLVTLGYDYINNTGRVNSSINIFWNSLTRLPNHNNALSYGILSLMLTTWLAAGFLFVSENELIISSKSWLNTIVTTLFISILIGSVYWLWHSGNLASLAQLVPQSDVDVIRQVARVGSLLTNYYIFSILIVLGLAFFLPIGEVVRKSETALISLLVSLILIIGVFWMVYKTNLSVIQADITFKMAEPFNRSTQWPIATLLYKLTNRLAPDQDHYYLFLGKSYLEQAKEEKDPAQQESLVKQAENDLKVAQTINPLNTDHTANLARLYSWWALKTNDPSTRRERGEMASDYYKTALTLSPNNSNLWGEWAILFSEVLNQPKETYDRLNHALSLDQKFNWTQGLMADYYIRVGFTLTDTVSRQDALEKAVEHYQEAIQLSKSSESQAKIGYLVGLASATIELGDLSKAITAYQEAIALNPQMTDLWRLEEAVARLYMQMGDKANAFAHANQSLQTAPEDQKEKIQTLIAQINELP